MNDISTLYIMSNTFVLLAEVEDALSVVWPVKFDGISEMTIQLPVTYAVDPNWVLGNVVMVDVKGSFMKINSTKTVVSEDGSMIFEVKGASGNSLLNQRVVTRDVFLTGGVDDVIGTLIVDHFINPTNPKRAYPMLTLKENTKITESMDDVFEPTTIYKIIESVCKRYRLGFEVTYDDGELIFCLLIGTDRTYDQIDEPQVIFSYTNQNVYNSSYLKTSVGSKNLAFVISDDLAVGLDVVEVYQGDEPSGSNRKEVVVDATDLTRIVDGHTISDGEFLLVMIEKGGSSLESTKDVGLFEGAVDTTGSFIYGVDYGLGDYVQCVFYGGDVKAQVLEYVRTKTNEGSDNYISLDFIT